MPDEKPVRYCSVCGVSSNDARIEWYGKINRYVCVKHRAQYKKYGYFLWKTKRDRNDYEICGDYAKIVFRDKVTQEVIGYSLIDAEDVEKCRPYKWWMTEKMGNTNYVKSIINGVNTGVHRFILGYHGDKPIDHINRDGLDNRKCNLRIVTNSENCTNTISRSATGYKNIYYKGDKFSVQIYRDYKKYCIGTFQNIEEAVRQRDKFIQQYNIEHDRVV